MSQCHGVSSHSGTEARPSQGNGISAYKHISTQTYRCKEISQQGDTQISMYRGIGVSVHRCKGATGLNDIGLK